MKLPIYMDGHATTAVDPRVMIAMTPYFTEHFGNPASRGHRFGWEASAAVEEARARCAAAIGAEPDEIIFTSGATESINSSIKGFAAAVSSEPSTSSTPSNGRHIVTTAVEHPAVLDTFTRLESEGFAATRLAVDALGHLQPHTLKAALSPETILVSVILANNEIGTINAISEISAICRARGVILHSDATQAVGHIPVDVRALGVDLLSASAHKFHGPKGVGFTYVRHGLEPRPLPLIDGGGHERGLRSGTLNVPGIVGMGEALRIAVAEMAEESVRVAALRERLERNLLERVELLTVNGDRAARLPGNLNVTIPFVEGEALLMGLREVALSTGSACASAAMKPSHVLRALGLPEDLVHSSIRFGLGRFNTSDEIEYVSRRVVEEVARLRDLSPQYEIHRRNAGSGRAAINARHDLAAPAC